jgi:bifunctional non-homologous end joining protein LigD
VTTLEVEGRALTLSSLNRVLWPEAGFTKGQMLEYYRAVSAVLLPHLRGRPLTMGRFPDGVDGRGFAQNECRGCPDWLPTEPIRLRNGIVRNYCLVNDLPSLLWVANQGAIELHPYLWLSGHPRPTTLVVDLDPAPPADLADCRTVALEARELLGSHGLQSVVKTSGSAGLHLFVPLDGRAGFPKTKPFARGLAEELALRLPALVATRQTRSRAGTVLVDWLQNDPMRSTVAPYSLRATRWPQVSTPVSWAEVESGRPLVFGPREVLERLERVGDLFRSVLELRQALPASASLRA